MKPEQASSSAEAALAMRALESARSRNSRLFRDENAKKLLRTHHRALIALCAIQPIQRCVEKLCDWKYPGAAADFICRTRFIDDRIEHGISQGLRKIVIVGAGYDTRSFRLARQNELQLIEIDHPSTQKAKLNRAKRAIAPGLLQKVQFVAHDFSQPLNSALNSQAPPSPTIFVVEGLTGYLSPASADALFVWMRNVSAPRSMVVFDYLDERFLEGHFTGKTASSLREYLQRTGEPFGMGWHPARLGKYCSEKGFELIENRSYLEFDKDYLAPLNRTLQLYEFGHIAVTRRQ